MTLRAWASLLVVLAPTLARAHPIDVAALELNLDGSELKVHLDISVPLASELGHLAEDAVRPDTLAQQAPVLASALLQGALPQADGQPCAWQPGTPAEIDGIRIHLHATARCPVAPKQLRWQLPFLEDAPISMRVLGRAQVGERRSEFMLAPGRETIALDGDPQAGSATLGAGGLFRAGLGALLALVALLLGRRTPRADVRLAVMFAVAQAVTYALAATDVVHVSQRLAEAAVTLLLAAVAAERILDVPDFSIAPQAVLVGLISGFRLAGGPARALPRLGTLGIEAVAAIAMIAGGAGLARRERFGLVVRRTGAGILVLVGVLRFVQALAA
jgi:hypothetical protein